MNYIEIIHVIKIRDDKNYLYTNQIDIVGPSEIKASFSTTIINIEQINVEGSNSIVSDCIKDDPTKLHQYDNVFKTLPTLYSVEFDTGQKLDINQTQFTDENIIFHSIAKNAEFIILKLRIQQNKISKIIGKAGKILFRETSKIELDKNTEYSLNLYTDEFIFEKTFKTEYDPFYCKVKHIRTDTGILLDDIFDETIADYIYDNSIIAKESYDLMNSSITSSSSANNPLLEAAANTTNSVLTNLHLYVRYKTDIDLILATYYGIAGSIGQVRKRIGTIDVERQKKLPYIKDLLNDLKRKLLEPEKELFGSKIIGKETLKAGNTSYPLSDPRRWERDV